MSDQNPESLWVDEHGAELVGMSVDDASRLIEEAGFRVWVFVPKPGTAMAANYVFGRVQLIAVDGTVRRVAAG